MKYLGCRDIGIFCDFEARAEQPEELVPQVMEHTSQSHGLEFVETEMSYEIHTWARNKMGKD
ncbi:MAG: hypothetical protein A2V67_12355 [Deltaproteobacteria bacterium RBG_13_61_14]|nr:MAG: hypothetical protein A2V67_12355 [Deltaproteobacteria bacterium RBG_13_61_14]